jgi:predicted RNA-binding Zn-ribbon protein involved in translation (DUF1610 family)
MGSNLEKSQLQDILDNSSTFKEVLEKANKNPKSVSGTVRRYLKKYIEEIGCSFVKFDKNHKEHMKALHSKLRIKNSHPDPFSHDSGLQSSGMKKHMLNAGFEYKCVKCKNDGNWQQESLSLQVDHINGDNRDNRKENLRFLCPNCHSQTKTGGSRKNKKKYLCPECKKPYQGHGVLCRSCSSSINNAKKFDQQNKKIEFTMSQDGTFLVFSITDAGSGFDPKSLRSITSTFYQHNRKKDEQQGGGLGLSICKFLTRINHGRIRFANFEQGAQVSLVFPLV